MSHMDLEIDVSKALGPGRRAMPLEAEVEREINAADIAMLAHADAGVESPPLKKVSQRHHMVARLLAAGTPQGEISMLTGYDPSRISILKRSPAMQELIQLYSQDVDEAFVGVLDHLAGVSQDAIVEIRDRLEDSPEDFSLKDLREVAEMGLDRTGYPRAKEVNQNVNHNFADRLSAARERAKKAAQGEIIDAEFIEEE